MAATGDPLKQTILRVSDLDTQVYDLDTQVYDLDT